MVPKVAEREGRSQGNASKCACMGTTKVRIDSLALIFSRGCTVDPHEVSALGSITGPPLVGGLIRECMTP